MPFGTQQPPQCKWYSVTLDTTPHGEEKTHRPERERKRKETLPHGILTEKKERINAPEGTEKELRSLI